LGHEAIDFTNWLAQSENLDALSEEIGVDIKLVKTEATVGKFSVDIAAEEEPSGRKIIIEISLKIQIMIIWEKLLLMRLDTMQNNYLDCSRDVREEHQKAIEWLNEHTDENINFFLIKNSTLAN